MLKGDQFYQYPTRYLSVTSVDILLAFSKKEGYLTQHANRGQIPIEITFISKLRRMLHDEIESTEGGLWSIILMKDADNGNQVYWKGVFILYVMPLTTILSIVAIRYMKRNQPQ